MPRAGYKSLTMTDKTMDRLREIAPRLGFYGEEAYAQRVIEHLLRLAEARPDFFHVVNRKRRYPPLDKRYAEAE